MVGGAEMPTLRQRQQQLREDAILEVADTLLRERGYEKMTMDEVAVHTGVAKMTLYTHFSSKEDLAMAIVVRRMEALYQQLATHAHDPSPAGTRFQAMVQATVVHHMEKWQAHLVLDRRIVSSSASFQEVDQRLAIVWGDVINQAKQEGSIRSEIETEVMVHILRRLYRLGMDELVSAGNMTSDQIIKSVVAFVIYGTST
jgi:AcrR family transcriptional regulator